MAIPKQRLRNMPVLLVRTHTKILYDFSGVPPNYYSFTDFTTSQF